MMNWVQEMNKEHVEENRELIIALAKDQSSHGIRSHDKVNGISFLVRGSSNKFTLYKNKDPTLGITLRKMSAMANTTPIVTTVTKAANKEKTSKEADVALKVNILDFCEEHYEDILLVIMDKIQRPKMWDRLRHNDENVFDRLCHQRQSTFDRLNDTYSPNTTKSGRTWQTLGIVLAVEVVPADETLLLAEIVLETETTSAALKDHMEGKVNPCYLACRRAKPAIEDTRSQNQKDASLQVKKTWQCPGHVKKWIHSRLESQKQYVKDPVEIYNIKQRDEETMKDFIERFKVETGRMKGASECMRISEFMHGVNNPELKKCLNEHVSKTIEEMMTITTAFIRGETVATSKKEGHTLTPKEILAAEAGKFKPPPPMVTQVEQRSGNKFCDFQNVKRPSMDECVQLKKQIEELVRAGKLSHLINEIKQDGGSSTKVLYEHCFNWLRPKIKSQMVLAMTSLTSFCGETIWPMGQHRLLVIIGDVEHTTKAWMNFMILRSLSPYNGIIGRPGIREIQSVPSTAHEMLKLSVDGGIITIYSTILIPIECAAMTTASKEILKEAEVRHENFKVALHPNFPNQESAIGGTLSVKGRTELCSLLKENLDIFTWQSSDMTGVNKVQVMGTLDGRLLKSYHYKDLHALHFRILLCCEIFTFQVEQFKFMDYAQFKGVTQILANFLVENPDEAPPDTSLVNTLQEPWTLFMDGSSCVDGSGAGLRLTSPEETEFTYALRFQFTASNNESEYEALIAGLRIAMQMGVRNVHVSVDSKLVANQVLGTYVAKEENMIKYLEKAKSQENMIKYLVSGFANFSISQIPRSLGEVLKEKSIQEKEVATVVKEDGTTWMTPIMEYLKDGTLPDDRKEGIDIAGPFPKGLRKVKFFIVAIDYFTKWIEAKALATITGSQNANVPHYGSGCLYNDEELRLNLDLLEERCERVAIRKANAKLKMTKYYNARVRGVTFGPGDFVYHSNDASHVVDGGKLGPKWEGPYEVTKALGDEAYMQRSMDGMVLP
nr:reverse transcriptase domain-containing protein [Tanacetum cinerariifolium]